MSNNAEGKYTGQALTVQQTAEIFRVAPTTIRKWIAAGLLEAILLPQRPGATKRYYRVKGDAIDKILESGNQPVT